MSLSLSAAIKAYLESTVSAWKPSSVAGCPWFRDEPTEGQAFPYGTINEGLSFVPSPNAVALGTEMAQVNIWQRWKPLTSSDASAPFDGLHKECPLLGPQVVRTLHKAQIATAPQRVLFASVANSIRRPDRDSNIVQTAITLYLRRVV